MKELALKIYALALELIQNPRAFWKSYANTDESQEELFRNLLYPLVGAAAAAVFLGEFFRSEYFRIWIAALWAIREVLLFAALYFGGIYGINELLKYLGYEEKTEALQKLIAYSLVPFLLVSTVTGFLPFLHLLDIFGVYSFYIFLLGARRLLLLPKEKRDNLILIIIAATWAVFGLLSFATSKLLTLLD